MLNKKLMTRTWTIKSYLYLPIRMYAMYLFLPNKNTIIIIIISPIDYLLGSVFITNSGQQCVYGAKQSLPDLPIFPLISFTNHSSVIFLKSL